jgi:hypothetical protein
MQNSELRLAEGRADDTDADEATLQDVDIDCYPDREYSNDHVDLWKESKGPDGMRVLISMTLPSASRCSCAFSNDW